MSKESPKMKIFDGYQIFETLPIGVHIVRRKWGLSVPVISSYDSEQFEKYLVPESGFGQLKSINDVLSLVKVDRLEGVPYRTFIVAPYPFIEVLDRMNGDRKQITLGVEYPQEDLFSSAFGFSTLDDISLEFKMKKDDWKMLDERKRKLSLIYKKMKSDWRRSLENKT